MCCKSRASPDRRRRTPFATIEKAVWLRAITQRAALPTAMQALCNCNKHLAPGLKDLDAPMNYTSIHHP